MIFLRLFFTFFKIGAFSFGGGYAIISIIRDTMLSNGWMSEETLIDIIAVAESTPGPIAINMATFVGAKEGGFLGSLCATLGMILPSFVIILIIAALISGLMKYSGVKAFIAGVRPCIIGMILSTAVTMGLSVLFSFTDIKGGFDVDIRGIFLLLLLFAISFIYKKYKTKKPSPILMILISAVVGVLLYAFYL